ncbi:sporulation peptidase YabG [Salipaludibacillus agaradhaerens]|uniref:Sporulation peptidase YabG n=1 Tax=Salipaludibacillus agaradhaerens TaxID=76935 RepID=A0A9Q4G0W3_SALAG|nr:sporulation peptidase YabG [Salipaludibacillus agaradhaerens]MCR6098417.1 sporulation peptidase YabG [Salipaludibacillus agaradhaerens]MCR6115953.1 sporulation peptidase YabG [Salipaludibacillus agaradhaerens]
MAEFKVGQIVGRSSYDCDVLFRIHKLNGDIAELHGEEVRLVADAPIDDLVFIQEEERKERKKKQKVKEDSCYHLFRQERKLVREQNDYEMTSGYTKKNSYFEMPGKVLHLDGDQLYLKKCTDVYDRLGVPVYGVYLPEKEMPQQIAALIDMVRPDLVVITGHDAYIQSRGDKADIKAYRNSKYFAESVREARKMVPYMDHLMIFAGACQSHFQSILKAGANFASSPKRVNIHALDPVYVVSKVSLTPFTDRISVWDILKTTLSGEKGLGGLESVGAMRRGAPFFADKHDDNERRSGRHII